MNSIYNINAYDTGVSYKKHDIISYTGTLNTMEITNGFLYCLYDTTGAFDSNAWSGYILDGTEIKPLFLWTPTKDNSVESAPKVRLLKLGDGYESRVPNGINNNLISYNLSFENLTTDEMTAIIHFFTTRNSCESFIWSGRPPYLQNLRFMAREWNDTEVYTNNFQIRTKFEQVVN